MLGPLARSQLSTGRKGSSPGELNGEFSDKSHRLVTAPVIGTRAGGEAPSALPSE